MSKFYITSNIGYGNERIEYIRPFATKAEAEQYLANCEEGSFDGNPGIEEASE